jgi:chlorophyllase-like protein
MLRRRLLVAVVSATALLTGPFVPAGAATPQPEPAKVAGNWAQPGPFPVAVEQGDTNTYYRPENLADSGPHPVIVWGNGTGGTPDVYDGLLRHLASHGFIVAAANTKNANSGQEMLAGAQWLISENDRQGSVYFHQVDVEHIGATGHSQGGAGAINAAADPIIDTTVPLQPGPDADPSKLHGPALFLAGQNDLIVPPSAVLRLYGPVGQVPARYAELRGAGHFEPVSGGGDGGGFRGVITAWFRYLLMGDRQAAAEFTGPSCGLCTDADFSDVRRNSLADQIQ